jgi:hypothetical protein
MPAKGQFPPPSLAPGSDRCSSETGRYGPVAMASAPGKVLNRCAGAAASAVTN